MNRITKTISILVWLLSTYILSLEGYCASASARFYIDRAQELKTSAPEKSLEYLQQALVICIGNKNIEEQIECYQLIGEINLINKLYESAVSNTLKAFNLRQGSTIIKGQHPMSLSVGALCLQLAKAYHGNENSKEAIKILNKTSYYVGKEKCDADLLLGEIYKTQKNYKASLNQYNKVLQNEVLASSANDLAIINSKIAEVYKDQNISQKSLEYLKKARLEALESKDPELIQDINKLISQELNDSKNYQEEIKVREHNLSICISKRDTSAYVNEAVALVYLYLRSNQFKRAEDLVNRVIYFAQANHNHIKFEALAYKAKAMLYQLNGNYPLSNTYYRYYANTIDTLLKRLEEKEAQSLKANVLFAEKQKQIDLLEKDATISRKTIEALSNAQAAIDERVARQKIIIWSLVFGIILFLASAYIIYKNAQKRRLANQLLALKSLRSQMNPHFIFNALNSVNSFISINDEKSANKYLADFSKLMRMVMENSQHEFITLSQEVEILGLYLSLEHFRFKNKFNYEFIIDERIDKDFVSIPPMIIQPHIENAIWHGLRYKEAMGFLKVHIYKGSDENIQITISDDGIGRQRSQELKTKNQKTTKSTGIKNTQSRIELIKEIYGKDITIYISDAYPQVEDSGTLVEISIPTHIKQENYA